MTELNKIFDSYSLIYDLSRNLNNKHLKEQSDKFNESILNKFSKDKLNHDELFRINKIILDFNKGKGNIVNISKETSLTSNSYLLNNANKILSSKEIDDENKQMLLENLILEYEKKFTLNIIKNMDDNLSDYKLLTRIFKHSTPGFNSRVESFINNNKKREYQLYFNRKNNMSEYGNQVALALFLLIKPDQLISILFSKIIRLIGMSGGIKQTDFISNLTTELMINLKYNFNKGDNFNNLSTIEKEVVESICKGLDEITVDSKFQFGILLLEFIMSEFDYIFVKLNIIENKENHI
jgi:hypothetical protein